MSFSEWNTYRLGDLIEVNKKSISKNFEYDTIEYFDTSSVTANKFSEPARLLLKEAPSRAKRIVEHNDILYSTVRPNQLHYGIIKNPKPNTVVSTGFAVLKAKGINPEYLFYYLTQNEIVEYLNSIAETSTTTFPAFNPSNIEELEAAIPDLKTQQRIASILSSLDDAIELNQQINKTLEEMAKAIFKEWFVDFNFPNATGKFQETEIGKIPVGWKVYSFGDLVNTVSETYRFGKKEKIIFLNTGDILEGEFLHRNYSEIASLPGQAKKSIKKNDILFSEIRPANKRYAFVNFEADEYVVSTKLMVLRSKGINPLLVYFLLTREEMLKQLQHLAESRSGTFPQITFTQLKDLKVALPTGETLDKFIKYLEAYYSQSKQNIEENQSLINLRDTLLPKLMKGEININL